MTGDLVVVTALLGSGPDRLGPPPPLVEGVRYVCVTDREDALPDGWERQPYTGPPGSSRLKARWVRAFVGSLFPPLSLWMDASFDLLVSPLRFVEAYLRRGVDLLAFRHPDRQRMRDEAAEMVRLGKIPTEAAAHQVAYYQALQWDTDDQPQAVLTVGGVLVQADTDRTRGFADCWWREIVVWGDRSDQLSLDFCAAQAGVTIGHLTEHYAKHPWIRYDRKRHLGLVSR